MNLPLIAVFLAVTMVHLAACLMDNQRLAMLSKPLLVPLLLALYLLSAEAPSPLVVLALVCGTVGDLALELPRPPEDPKSPHPLLITGLTAFLLGHVFYIIAFLRSVPVWPLPTTAALLLCAVFLFLLVYLPLRSHMGRLALPGTAYLAVLIGMVFSAALSALTVPAPLRLPGGLLFLLSDYILARSILFQKKRYTDFFVMLTYLGAQLLLVSSLL